jgi:hypothetical protein
MGRFLPIAYIAPDSADWTGYRSDRATPHVSFLND